MLHPVSPNALLRIAHSSQCTLLSLRASISSAHYHHAHNTFRHTSPPSRQLHDHPAAHDPRDQQASSPPPISTVNDAEIAHFSRLSALWWDERGEFALLHKMNPHRVRFIREKVLEVQRDERPYSGLGAATTTPLLECSRVLEGMDVLDVGCGGGILSEVRLFLFSLPASNEPNKSPSTFPPSLAPSQGRTRFSEFVIDYSFRVSRVSGQTRSPSTRRRRISASRRATLNRTRASQRYRSAMRRLRCSYRRRSGSISFARWRSLSMWTTRLRS